MSDIKMKRSSKQIIIGLLTLLLIIIMIFFVDIGTIITNLNKISFVGVLLFVVIYTSAFLLRALRLKIIFKGINLDSSYLTLFGSFGIGWAINDITPGKVGDFVRIEIIHEKEKMRMSKSICGVAIERVIDILILFIFSTCTLLLLYFLNIQGTTELNLQFYVGIVALLLLGGGICLLILIFKTEWILNIIGKISLKLKELLKNFLESFNQGIVDFLKNKKAVTGSSILSLLIWVLETIPLITFFYLSGYTLQILIIILAQIVVFFSKIFPITPGGWVISDNIGAIFITLFYPTLLYNDILSIFILYHIIGTAYLFVYGVSFSLILATGFHFQFKKYEFKESNNNLQED
jgi:hypothetical protein